MQILLASSMGLCFGVRDALRTASALPHPQAVTIHGQLVHNPAVLTQLTRRGFHTSDETQCDLLPASRQLMITAHGISNTERTRLLAAGKSLIDTTCPLVRRAHDAALRLHAEGYHVLVLGKPGHVEVRGLTGDLTSFTILESPADVRTFLHPRLGIIAQTTTAPTDAEAICRLISERNPHAHLRRIDTICQPTKDRQLALEELLTQVDTVVIVGGHNSNNTRRLVDRCLERRLPAHHVEVPDDLRPHWFTHTRTLGLTAGTSTLPETITAVHAALQKIARQHMSF